MRGNDSVSDSSTAAPETSFTSGLYPCNVTLVMQHTRRRRLRLQHGQLELACTESFRILSSTFQTCSSLAPRGLQTHGSVCYVARCELVDGWLALLHSTGLPRLRVLLREQRRAVHPVDNQAGSRRIPLPGIKRILCILRPSGITEAGKLGSSAVNGPPHVGRRLNRVFQPIDSEVCPSCLQKSGITIACRITRGVVAPARTRTRDQSRSTTAVCDAGCARLP